MSDFSNLIERYMKQSRVTGTELSEGTGLGKIVYKYIKGTRVPSSIDTVVKIADYLNMTSADSLLLKDYWKNEHFGAERIALWGRIDKFLKHFQINTFHSDVCLFDSTSLCRFPDKEMFYLNGDMNIHQAILTLLSTVGDEPVYAVMQPNDSGLQECLIMAKKLNPSLEIRNIISLLPRSHGADSSVYYNLDLLQSVIPLAFSSNTYHSYYYYSDGSIKEKWPMHSNYIITSGYALIFGRSYDTMSGILSRDKNLIDDLRNNFYKIMQESRPLISLSTDPMNLMGFYYSKIQDRQFSRRIQYSMQPCLCPYLSMDICKKYLNQDIPNAGMILDSFLSNMEYYRNYMRSCSKEIISIEGIRRFLKTGRIDELLDELYSPLSVEDRVLVLRNWLECISPESVCFLSPESFPVQYGLTISTMPFLFTTTFIFHGKVYTFSSEEPTITSTFWDYFSNFDERRFLPFEEGKCQVEKMINGLSR
ncbi:MAG: helix-turn-helix domain-containing protein [Candidatus Weimeria sp.]